MEKENPMAFSAAPQGEVEAYINKHYEMRFNVLTALAEMRERGSELPYRVVDKRVMNSMLLDIVEHGMECKELELKRLLCSDRIRDFHPMQAYMQGLDEWDGKDRVTSLIRRLTDNLTLINAIHRWMLGMAAQWEGRTMECANALAPILVSERQGLGKSSFCRHLLPDELQFYYTDKLALGENSHLEQKLGTLALINLDEFDRIPENRMAELKNVMQMKSSTHRKLYTNNFVEMPRMASFIGTSNSHQLLTDPTGSRRFICVEVKEDIDRSPINHRQLYAQLHHELEQGERTYLTHSEEAEVELLNQAFYRVRPEEEVFRQMFCLPTEEGETVELTSVEIFNRLQHRNPSAMRGSNPRKFCHTLTKLCVPRIHRMNGNFYQVQLVG